MGSGATKYKSVQEALDAGVSQADVDAYMKDRKPAFESFGIYQGTWWSPGYSYNLGVDFTLKNGKDGEHNWVWEKPDDPNDKCCSGKLIWKVQSCTNGSQFQLALIGLMAEEWVKGTFDWKTGEFEFAGYGINEAGKGNIGLDAYKLKLDVEQESLSGKTRTHARNWAGNVTCEKVSSLSNLTPPVESADALARRINEKISEINMQKGILKTFAMVPGLHEALAKADPLQMALEQRELICPNMFMATYEADTKETEELLLQYCKELLNPFLEPYEERRKKLKIFQE